MYALAHIETQSQIYLSSLLIFFQLILCLLHCIITEQLIMVMPIHSNKLFESWIMVVQGEGVDTVVACEEFSTRKQTHFTPYPSVPFTTKSQNTWIASSQQIHPCSFIVSHLQHWQRIDCEGMMVAAIRSKPTFVIRCYFEERGANGQFTVIVFLDYWSIREKRKNKPRNHPAPAI